MKHLVEYPLEAGGSILVEVDEAQPSTLRSVRAGELAERAEHTFEEALSKIKPAAESLLARLRSLTDAPDQVGVEFGLKLSAGAGAILASASTEANFKITLTWKRGESKGSKGQKSYLEIHCASFPYNKLWE